MVIFFIATTTFSLFRVQLPSFVATLVFQNTVLIVLCHFAGGTLHPEGSCFHNVTITGGQGSVWWSRRGKRAICIQTERGTQPKLATFDGKSLQMLCSFLFFSVLSVKFPSVGKQ